jgi:hypothetical protein
MTQSILSQHSSKCDGKFTEGIAIKSEHSRSVCWWGNRISNADTLEIIPVAKCNKCGHSDDDLTLIQGDENGKR